MKIGKRSKDRVSRRSVAAKVLYAVGVDVQDGSVSVLVTQGKSSAMLVLRGPALDQFSEIVTEAVAMCRRNQ